MQFFWLKFTYRWIIVLFFLFVSLTNLMLYHWPLTNDRRVNCARTVFQWAALIWFGDSVDERLCSINVIPRIDWTALQWRNTLSCNFVLSWINLICSCTTLFSFFFNGYLHFFTINLMFNLTFRQRHLLYIIVWHYI